MAEDGLSGEYAVHCRTGSLEKLKTLLNVRFPVHCRTGSLERMTDRIGIFELVHCRSGSSVKAMLPDDYRVAWPATTLSQYQISLRLAGAGQHVAFSDFRIG